MPTIVLAEQVVIDKGIVEFCNNIMMDIYKEIWEQKDKDPRLADFGEDNFIVNSDGIYAINYETKDTEGKKWTIPLKFSLSIIRFDEVRDFEGEKGIFNFGFPLLNVNIVGFQNYVKRDEFDIQNYVKKYGKMLWNEQKQYIPYKLTLSPEKESFGVGEEIAFTITLLNKTKKNLIFKELNDVSLFLEYDGGSWGEEAPSIEQLKRVRNLVVNHDESMSKRLTIGGFNEPGEYDIFCVYAVGYKGVNPSDSMKVIVVPKSAQ
jgi:hypothetical protein